MTSARLALAVCVSLTAVAAAVLTAPSDAAGKSLPLHKGDRIILIGNTLAEREQYFGHFETLLHSRFPEHELVVRNLGWSADELTLRPRQANFDQHGHTLHDEKPDAILAFFGFNESFAGPAGLPKFETDLDRFIAETTAAKYNGKTPPRLVLFSPIAHEDLGRPGLVDGKANNKNIQLYTESMVRIAAQRNVLCVDLFTPTLKLMRNGPQKLTFNGVHLTDHGYRLLAPIMDEALFGPRPANASKVDLEKLRREILEKDLQFFYDYRAVNGCYIYGGRKNPFGVINFPDEFTKLRKMIANRDQRVWAVAQGKSLPDPIDDRNTGDLKPIPTNHTARITLTEADEAIKKFTLPEGFEINLFASEKEFPDLQKPVQMAFDAQGRLWVVTMPSYPMYEPGRPVNDKVLIFEDTKDAGKADKCTVFADKLHVPTGIALADGGAYVAQQPNLVFLKDTKGTGKADHREIILHGFDTADSHHSINAFRWGPGGDLYFMEGTFLHTQVETPYGPQRVKNAGVFRYEPKTEKLDVFVSYGFANPWGICWDRWGQNYVADASGGANYLAAAFSGRVNYPQKHAGLKEFLKKQWRPTCGCEIVASRNFPESMQGNYLLNNCIGFLGTLQYKFKEDGSGLAADPVEPLLRSSDPNFRPVDIMFGPDGALYICDWFNPLIGHMQHSLRDPNRDTRHGRIWRITYKNNPLVKKPRIADQPIAALLALLKEPEAYTRNQARIELRRHDSARVMAELDRWIAQLDPADRENEHHRLEVLWVCQHHDVVHETLLTQLLRSPDHRARAAATRVLCYWRDRVQKPLDLLRVQVNDAHPRVRLEAVRALSFFDGPEAQAVALESLGHPQDYYLEYAFKETMATLGPVANLFTAGKLPKEKQGGLVKLLCQQGNAAELERLYRQCLTPDGFPTDVRRIALESLAEAAQLRRVQPKADLADLGQLIRPDKERDVNIRLAALRLAGVWKVQALRSEMEQLALAADVADPFRLAALDGLVQIGGPESRTAIEKLLTADRPLNLRYVGAAALARLDASAAAPRAAAVLAQGDDRHDPAPVLAAFLDLKGGAEKLASALETQKVPADVAKLALRHMNAAGRADAPLVKVLSAAAGFNVKSKAPTAAEVKQMVEDVVAKGDAARGEKVFRRGDLNCLKCHAIHGAGGDVGPDLKDVGSVSPPDYVLKSVLVPDESIKEAFETLVVLTGDGKIHHGVPVEETKTRLVLKDATGQLRVVPKADIEERKKGGSLMPAGMDNFMTRGELIDLVRFLCELGKPGPYALQLTPTLRRWRVLRSPTDDVTDALRFQEKVLGADAAQWSAVYAKVSGMVPLDEVAPISGAKVLYLQGEIDVRTAGKVGLQLDAPEGLRLWIDDQPVSVAATTVADLTVGRHKLTFRIDMTQRTTRQLRVDLMRVEGSPATAAMVVGP